MTKGVDSRGYRKDNAEEPCWRQNRGKQQTVITNGGLGDKEGLKST